MNNRLWTVQMKSVYKVVDEVQKQQRELIKFDSLTSRTELTQAYMKVFYLLGIIDNLKGLGLLDNEIYQSLIEENVNKKSTQPTANRVERTSNIPKP